MRRDVPLMHETRGRPSGQGLSHGSTVEYLFRSDMIPSRLACVFPKPVQILVILRNPTERAHSDYHMYLRQKRLGLQGTADEFRNIVLQEKEVLEFSGVFPGLDPREGLLAWKRFHYERKKSERMTAVFNVSDPDYLQPLSRGLYALQLSHWVDTLSDLWGLTHEELFKRHLLVLDNDHVKTNMEATIAQVLEFSGLPPHTFDDKQFRKSGKIRNYTSLTAEDRQFLDAYFRPYNAALHHLLKSFGVEIEFAKQAFEATHG
eukprot:Nitzschia sp. Nitz4//scaffold159_size51929//47273//48055//NITZ4_006887-RA/size51929-processed-gene-0.47-mRNA-1//1//CDS//3329537598//7523//frame0